MGGKKLGGATFCWNAVSQDYCCIETLECLYELCDAISIVFGGTDGTEKLVKDWINSKHNKTIIWQVIDEQEWLSQQGRFKLSHFSNLGIAQLEKIKMDYVVYLQADEIISENSFPYIREAINTSAAEAFLVTRLNLWSSPYWMLDVPQHRKPVSTEIVRITKPCHRCVDDAESIGVPSFEYLLQVRFYHMGFVRDKYKHIGKIIHMQKDVFLMDYDKRVHDCENGFDHWKFGFSPTDIVPVYEPLPKFIQKWAEERNYPMFREADNALANLFIPAIRERFGTRRSHKYSTTAWKDANDLVRQINKMTQEPKK